MVGNCRFGQATARHFMKFLSLFSAGFGFMMAGWTKRRQALHDMPSDCIVIRAPQRRAVLTPASLKPSATFAAVWPACPAGVISNTDVSVGSSGTQVAGGSAVVLVAGVTVSYWIATSRVRSHAAQCAQDLGIDIQQTSDGFSLSKSEAGRTLYTIRASKAVQFKAGGHADLHNVHIVVYGHTHDRYDQIYGNQFTYDPQTGDVNAVGEVHIDLQGNAEGPPKPDQAPPAELKNPLHLLTHSLTFNQNTGIAHTDEVVEFRSAQATGSARGAYYDSKDNQLQLKSDVHIVTIGDQSRHHHRRQWPHPERTAAGGAAECAIEQPDKTLTADKGTMLFEADNTVQHAVAEGNVHMESRGPTIVDITGPRGDLNMGPKNAVQQAVLIRRRKFDTRGANLTHGSADKFVVDFDADNSPTPSHDQGRAHDAGAQARQVRAARAADGDRCRPARFPARERQPTQDRRHRRQGARSRSSLARRAQARPRAGRRTGNGR